MKNKSVYELPDLWKKDKYENDSDQVRRIEATVSMIPKGITSLLDVGCGNGFFLKKLERKRPMISLLGIDSSTAALKAKLCNAPINHGLIDSIDAGNKSVELVSALEVIEHLPQKQFIRALEELSRVAKEYILLSVPYNESRVIAKCKLCGCVYNADYHLRSFSHSDLELLIDDFEIVEKKVINIDRIFLFYRVKEFLNRVFKVSIGSRNEVCPQCGFQNKKVISKSSSNKSINEIRRFFPKESVPRWVIILYKRKTISNVSPL